MFYEAEMSWFGGSVFTYFSFSFSPQIILFLNVEMLRADLIFGPIVLVLGSTIMPCIHGLSFFILISLTHKIHRTQPVWRKTCHTKAKHFAYSFPFVSYCYWVGVGWEWRGWWGWGRGNVMGV